jgi:hypothetical protein
VSDNLFRLAQRIRAECDELGRVVDRAQEGWRRAQRSPDDLYLDSVALNLHGFYAGLERLFEMIAGAVDGRVPRGENWHRVLLEQVATEAPSVRPAVISDETRRALEDYRGFRHVVRNVYTLRLDPAKLRKLAEGASAVYSQVRAELLAFADFLEQRGAEIETDPLSGEE